MLNIDKRRAENVYTERERERENKIFKKRCRRKITEKMYNLFFFLFVIYFIQSLRSRKIIPVKGALNRSNKCIYLFLFSDYADGNFLLYHALAIFTIYGNKVLQSYKKNPTLSCSQ